MRSRTESTPKIAAYTIKITVEMNPSSKGPDGARAELENWSVPFIKLTTCCKHGACSAERRLMPSTPRLRQAHSHVVHAVSDWWEANRRHQHLRCTSVDGLLVVLAIMLSERAWLSAAIQCLTGKLEVIAPSLVFDSYMSPMFPGRGFSITGINTTF